MAVEALDVVVSALAAGGVAGAKDTASTAVKDAYAGLLGAVRRRFGHDKARELDSISQEHLDRELGERGRLLASALADVRLEPDDDLVETARAMLARLDAAGPQAPKYAVDVRDSQGVQVGDHNMMTLNLGSGEGEQTRDRRRGH